MIVIVSQLMKNDSRKVVKKSYFVVILLCEILHTYLRQWANPCLKVFITFLKGRVKLLGFHSFRVSVSKLKIQWSFPEFSLRRHR